MLKRLSRDSWLAIGLVMALVVIMIISYLQQGRRAAPPLASFSSQPNGARALRLWLEMLGYVVENEAPPNFFIPEAANLVLILEPTEPVTPLEWRALDDWVAAGGTLIIAGDQYSLPSWAGHFELERVFALRVTISDTLRLQHPLLHSPPMGEHPALVATTGVLTTTRSDLVVHAATDEGAVVVSFAQGEGQVVLSTLAFPFSNRGLRVDGTPELVLNLISLAGEPGMVWFDEWHHGLRGQGEHDPVGFGAWLRGTVAGRSLLLAAAIIFLALLLQGRPFGRPVPLLQQIARRTPLEYVTAMANLNRRAGHRTALLQDYHLRLKRELGRRYRLDPAMPDGEFVTQLASLDPTLDQGALRQLLADLSHTAISEQQMVRSAAEAARWLAGAGK